MTDLQTKQGGQLAPNIADDFIKDAIASQVPVETMKELLAMRTQLKEEQAKEAFYRSLAAFQAECPTIPKTKVIKGKNGQVRSKYSPLDDTIRIVGPLLEKHGFSYVIKTEVTDMAVSAIVETHHVMGHSDSSSFAVPIDKDAFMNDSQKAGSARTFAKRYAFEDAFGILTGDTDDDGNSLGQGVSPQDLYKKFRAVMDGVLEHYETIMCVKEGIAEGNLEQAVEALYELNNDQLQQINLAYTKGGPFTTEEVSVMKSNDWHAARKNYFGNQE